jgi:hypothetical protein
VGAEYVSHVLELGVDARQRTLIDADARRRAQSESAFRLIETVSFVFGFLQAVWYANGTLLIFETLDFRPQREEFLHVSSCFPWFHISLVTRILSLENSETKYACIQLAILHFSSNYLCIINKSFSFDSSYQINTGLVSVN